MPRPRNFDRDDVLERALDAFWRQGYEATSIQDLVDAMGISRASLYNAFDSKHALFMEVLKHYEAQRMQAMVDRLCNPSTPAPDAIREVLEQAASSDAADKRGCLMTNTAIEMCMRDAECTERVQVNFDRIESAFADAIERGQRGGDLSPGLDSQAMARYFTNALQGLRVMTAAHTDREALDDVVNVTMQMIDG